MKNKSSTTWLIRHSHRLSDKIENTYIAKQRKGKKPQKKHTTAFTAVSQSNKPPNSPTPNQVSEDVTRIPERRHEREAAQAQTSMTQVASVQVVVPSTPIPEEKKDVVQDAETPERHKAAYEWLLIMNKTSTRVLIKLTRMPHRTDRELESIISET